VSGGEPVEQVIVGWPCADDVIEIDVPVLFARRGNVAGGPAVHAALMPDQVTDDPVRTARNLSVKPGRLGRGPEPLAGVVDLSYVLVYVHEWPLWPMPVTLAPRTDVELVSSTQHQLHIDANG
jgi:hypothetical protein